MDLVAGTHGRGIYKMNLKPIHEWVQGQDTISPDYLFNIPVARLPKRNDTHRDIEYSSMQKVPITFFCEKAGKVLISLQDGDNTIWSREFDASEGFNQYRWDLVISETDNQLPYFIHYLSFPQAGEYKVKIESDAFSLSRNIKIINWF